jgi:hypothetical protein
VTNVDVGTPVPPTGSVTFSSDGAGTFSAGSCSVSGTGATATCQVSYTPNPGSEGQHTITADYLGDNSHLASAASFVLTVGTRSTSASLSCIGRLHVGKLITCTVTVVDTSPGTPMTPAGTATFTSSHPGHFSSTTCQLSENNDAASCSVTFTPSRTGSDTITATYGGDSDHTGSTQSNTFRVLR